MVQEVIIINSTYNRKPVKYEPPYVVIEISSSLLPSSTPRYVTFQTIYTSWNTILDSTSNNQPQLVSFSLFKSNLVSFFSDCHQFQKLKLYIKTQKTARIYHCYQKIKLLKNEYACI